MRAYNIFLFCYIDDDYTSDVIYQPQSLTQENFLNISLDAEDSCQVKLNSLMESYRFFTYLLKYIHRERDSKPVRPPPMTCTSSSFDMYVLLL